METPVAGPLTPEELWFLRVGFSYALESLAHELEDMRVDADWFNDSVLALRNSQRPIGKQPPCIRDRFAFFTQTIRLTREETDQFRTHTFGAT